MVLTSEAPREGDGPRRFPQGRFRVPEGACELVIVRHGQSEDAVEGREFARFAGHADPPLSELGRHQAVRLAARLEALPLDAVYVTTLRRTAETAAPLVDATGLVPVVEHDLRELHLGEWEGWVFEQKFVDRDPLALRLIEEQRWDLIPGCEPADEFAARVRGAVERIAAAHPDGRVLLVVHGLVIAEILSQAAGAGHFAFIGADNASISHVVVTGRRWVVRRYNDTTHLDERLTVRAAPPI